MRKTAPTEDDQEPNYLALEHGQPSDESDQDLIVGEDELQNNERKKRGKKSASILNYTWLSITKFHNVKSEAEALTKILNESSRKVREESKMRHRRLIEKAQAQRTRLEERITREKHQATIYEVRRVLNKFPRE